jgi:hypothetical protein
VKFTNEHNYARVSDIRRERERERERWYQVLTGGVRVIEVLLADDDIHGRPHFEVTVQSESYW